jgi:DNA replication licensing factor MCM6
MIRLSEAIAKASCVDEVSPAFVDEAFQLLRQSIISVEKDDIDIDDENTEELQAAILAAAEQDDELDAIMDDSTPAPRQKTVITSEEYNAMIKSLAGRVNADSEQDGDGVEEEDLVTWYLEKREHDLETTEAHAALEATTRKVIRRMVKVCFDQCCPLRDANY